MELVKVIDLHQCSSARSSTLHACPRLVLQTTYMIIFRIDRLEFSITQKIKYNIFAIFSFPKQLSTLFGRRYRVIFALKKLAVSPNNMHVAYQPQTK